MRVCGGSGVRMEDSTTTLRYSTQQEEKRIRRRELLQEKRDRELAVERGTVADKIHAGKVGDFQLAGRSAFDYESGLSARAKVALRETESKLLFMRWEAEREKEADLKVTATNSKLSERERHQAQAALDKIVAAREWTALEQSIATLERGLEANREALLTDADSNDLAVMALLQEADALEAAIGGEVVSVGDVRTDGLEAWRIAWADPAIRVPVFVVLCLCVALLGACYVEYYSPAEPEISSEDWFAPAAASGMAVFSVASSPSSYSMLTPRKTYVTGEMMTASDLNLDRRHIIDAINALRTQQLEIRRLKVMMRQQAERVEELHSISLH
ncbi:hypothetical protein LCGC14_1218160 [marine sediment metagenome]|uniref:Uncharacterized protein n=1 Tax=marine sediment metagenome TaxID=412755 RepID=A0A0F9LC48_9ZZZZ